MSVITDIEYLNSRNAELFRENQQLRREVNDLASERGEMMQTIVDLNDYIDRLAIDLKMKEPTWQD